MFLEGRQGAVPGVRWYRTACGNGELLWWVPRSPLRHESIPRGAVGKGKGGF